MFVIKFKNTKTKMVWADQNLATIKITYTGLFIHMMLLIIDRPLNYIYLFYICELKKVIPVLRDHSRERKKKVVS